MGSFQVLGILVINQVGEFQFIPVNSVPRISVKQKQEPVLDTDTGIDEPLSPADFKVEQERDKTPKNLDETLRKYNKSS